MSTQKTQQRESIEFHLRWVWICYAGAARVLNEATGEKVHGTPGCLHMSYRGMSTEERLLGGIWSQ